MTTLIATLQTSPEPVEPFYNVTVAQIANLPLATAHNISDRALVEGISGTEETSVWINMLNEQPFNSGNFVQVWANLTTGQTETGS